jgi:hypothetical protein
MVDLFFFFFIARANQKIRILALGRGSSPVDGVRHVQLLGPLRYLLALTPERASEERLNTTRICH